jgi:hypothetical protein
MDDFPRHNYRAREKKRPTLMPRLASTGQEFRAVLMQTDSLQRRAIALKPSAQPPQGCRAIGLKLLRLPLNYRLEI